MFMQSIFLAKANKGSSKTITVDCPGFKYVAVLDTKSMDHLIRAGTFESSRH